MDRQSNYKIVFETGEEFLGKCFGAPNKQKIMTAVFDTSVVGYQEIITEPSYAGQAVVMGYPIIGNYGITDEDNESKSAWVGGLIVRDYNDQPSNFRSTKTLGEILEDYGICAIYGVDTRKITQLIRSNGPTRVMFAPIEKPTAECVEEIRAHVDETNPLQQVGCRKKWYSRTEHSCYNVVAIDCGIKTNVIRQLNRLGCNVTVMPHTATAEQIAALSPDGIVVSGGPATPADLEGVSRLIGSLRGKYAVFAYGSGLYAVCMAYGAVPQKMHCGHRGGYPVKCVKTGKIESVYQCHGYEVSEESLSKTCLKVTHVNALDGGVEGVECVEDKIFAVQYVPGGAPGPQDSEHIFKDFTALMEENKNA